MCRRRSQRLRWDDVRQVGRRVQLDARAMEAGEYVAYDARDRVTGRADLGRANGTTLRDHARQVRGDAIDLDPIGADPHRAARRDPHCLGRIATIAGAAKAPAFASREAMRRAPRRRRAQRFGRCVRARPLARSMAIEEANHPIREPIGVVWRDRVTLVAEVHAIDMDDLSPSRRIVRPSRV